MRLDSFVLQRLQWLKSGMTKQLHLMFNKKRVNKQCPLRNQTNKIPVIWLDCNTLIETADDNEAFNAEKYFWFKEKQLKTFIYINL